jgi:hypothetical protein
LALWSNRLTDSLPSTLFSLTGLSYFDLGRNSLVGPLPSYSRNYRCSSNLLTGSSPCHCTSPRSSMWPALTRHSGIELCPAPTTQNHPLPDLCVRRKSDLADFKSSCSIINDESATGRSSNSNYSDYFSLELTRKLRLKIRASNDGD